MARDERDREDLLREASALVARAEITIDGMAENVILGFRRTGGASFYFGPDRAYQFNSDDALRRAHVAGLLYKAEGKRLASLRRVREADEVQLLRRDLDDAALGAFLEEADTWLVALEAALAEGRYRVVGQVPEESDVLVRGLRWLEGRPRPIDVADTPHAQ